MQELKTLAYVAGLAVIAVVLMNVSWGRSNDCTIKTANNAPIQRVVCD